MDDEPLPAADPQTDAVAEPAAHHRRWTAGRIAAWGAGVFGGLILLLVLAVLGLNTDPGRRFVARQISGFELASGLRFEVGRLDGSLYDRLTIRDLRIHDARGVFAVVPEVALDWRPFSFINNHADIRTARIPFARVARLPELRPSEEPVDPNAPLLPNIDIDIGRLQVDRLVLDAPVSGERRVLSLNGRASIADGRAQLETQANELGRGDRLQLTLDAVPDANRLDINARVNAPANGLIASMAGLSAPMVATIDGRGSWAAWNGRAQATLGGQPLANLALQARNGTFSLRGPTRPGLILTGPVERLTAPQLNVDAQATFAERVGTGRIRLTSDALAVDAQGGVDLARSRFNSVRVDAQLLQPGSIAENLNGRDVRAAVILDGPFATPLVDYAVTAAAIGFGETVVERLQARGRARVDADRILIPVNARAARITGLNAAAGGLLTNVSLNGQLAWSGNTILSDNLRIRSDRIDATALVVADLSTGIYRGALRGRVNDYAIDGVGIINLNTDINLTTTPSGGFGLAGRVAAQTVRIDNQSARDFLGGRTFVSAQVSFDPEGVAAFRNLRLNAPLFRITSGEGSYRPDGRIAFNAVGLSDIYGPLRVGVTGTATQPLIRLRAERPNVGVQLTNVDATIRGTGRGYQVDVTGGSPYGPFSADLFVATGGGPLTIDIADAQFAGVNLAGRVVQTAAGPFTGRLTLAGQDLQGVVGLGVQDGVQRARVSARATGFQVPGETPIQIGRAIVEADIVLYPAAPLITADVQAAGVQSGTFTVQTARGRVNYRGGRGTAQLLAEGNSGTSFRIASTVDLTPDLYRAALTGTVGGIDLRTASPAVIERSADGYVLRPTAVVLGGGGGQVRLAGRFGDTVQAQARLDRFDLGILNAFTPGAGLGGAATGSLDYAQTGNAFPRADLRINIDNFTRSSAVTVSQAIDVSLLGTLRPEGGALAAVMRRGGGVIGRAQVRLQPVSGAGSWTEQLAAAPLAGGIRYNGPADALWSLAGISGQTISGPIGVAADFSGRVDRPQLNGVLRANALTYTNDIYGTRISAIRLNGRFSNDRLEITEFAGRAGDGTVSGAGSVGLSSAAGFPIDLRVQLQNAQLARSNALSATVSGNVAVTNSAAAGGLIEGELRLPEIRYEVVRQGQAEIAELEGVRRRGSPSPAELAARQREQGATAASPPGLFRLNLRVRADNQLFVSGMGLESEWGADLRVTGTNADPRVVGNVELVRGTYSFAGKRFELDQASLIRFDGGPLTNPELQIAAETTVDGITATIDITGRAQNPQIAFGSVPTLPQDEVLSRLLFGNSVTELSATQALQLAAALNSLRGSGGGGLNPLGTLRSATGIDRLRILGADEATGRGTAVAAGTYISNDIYLEVITDARGFTATQIEIALSRTLSVLSSTGSFGGSNINLRYSRDY